MGHPTIIIAAACIALAILFSRPVLHFALPLLARIRTPKNLRERVMLHYQGKNFDAWMFAWFKTGLDPMFRELPEFLKSAPPIKTFLDLGCGFGLAGCLVLELLDGAKAYAVDPNPARVAAAAAAMGDRGQVFEGAAPDFAQPQFPDHFDAAFALDMIHFLPDAALDLTLQRIRARLSPGDPLFIRSPINPVRSGSLKMKLYRLYARYNGTFITFRTAEQIQERIRKAGFEMTRAQISGTNPELFWFIAAALVTNNRGEEETAPQMNADERR